MADFWFWFTVAVLPVPLLVFGARETWALLTGRETYTVWIRRQLGLMPVQPRRKWAAPLFALILGGFFAWFLPHIELGVWPR